jgi:hypothetical protein
MKNTNLLTKILAVCGTIFGCLPILAPIVLGFASLWHDSIFHFDYFMPAELFPLAILGGGLLVWAAFRTHAHQQLIAWGLGIAIVSLVGGQALAVVTGLADGSSQSVVWLVVVMSTILIYVLAVIMFDVGGMMLLRTLFRSTPSSIKGI